MFGKFGTVLEASGRRHLVFFDFQRGDPDAKGYWHFDIELEEVALVRCVYHLLGTDAKGWQLYQREVPMDESLERGKAGALVGTFSDRYAAMEQIDTLSLNCSEFAIFE